MVAGFVIRRKIDETPVFEQNRSEVAKLPVAVLFRTHWKDVLRVIVAATIASVSTIFTVYALSYAVNTVGLDRGPMLWVGVLANVAALLAIPLLAGLSDRIGRKPVFIAGCLACAVLIFPYLWSILDGSYPLIFALGILLFGIAYSAVNGVWPSFYGEMFSAKVRLSGMAIGTQIGFAIAGFAPSVVSAIGSEKQDWFGVAIFTAAICLLSAAAAMTARETHNVATEDLGIAEPVPAGAVPR